MTIREKIVLSEYTTIRLGGPAAYFVSCGSVEELQQALTFAQEKQLRIQVLGGGSNTIFADDGFNGLVIKVDLTGIDVRVRKEDEVIVTAAAGEEWDSFVVRMVESGYAGVECLSGIPGSVGATPIQNVGAYGQEVKESIVSVSVLDRESLEQYEIAAADCGFSYRMSRWKANDAGRHIVTAVTYRLRPNGSPAIVYPEVKKKIGDSVDLGTLPAGAPQLRAVRDVVLSLRAAKSMVIDPHDPNTRSVGSFFLNPIVSREELEYIRSVWSANGDGSEVPVFPHGGRFKVPAAWLIERAGFKKGYRHSGVGISQNHTLALVNYSGTTAMLMELAEEIARGVAAVFRVTLEPEANVIQ